MKSNPRANRAPAIPGQAPWIGGESLRRGRCVPSDGEATYASPYALVGSLRLKTWDSSAGSILKPPSSFLCAGNLPARMARQMSPLPHAPIRGERSSETRNPPSGPIRKLRGRGFSARVRASARVKRQSAPGVGGVAAICQALTWSTIVCLSGNASVETLGGEHAEF